MTMTMAKERVKSEAKQDAANTTRDGGFLENMTEGMAIDPNALDEALISQVSNFHQISERLALDISLRDEAKDRLKQAEAEADEAVRADARTRDIKVTETSVKNAIIQDADVMRCQKEFARLNKSAALLSALKESYLQRSYALKELVSLYLAGYFGEGMVENAASSRVKEQGHSRSREALNDERKRRARA